MAMRGKEKGSRKKKKAIRKNGNEANLTKRLFAKQSSVFFLLTSSGRDCEVSFAFFPMI